MDRMAVGTRQRTAIQIQGDALSLSDGNALCGAFLQHHSAAGFGGINRFLNRSISHTVYGSNSDFGIDNNIPASILCHAARKIIAYITIIGTA